MGLFVKLELNLERCLGVKECGKCIKVCPVSIFTKADRYPVSIEANEDECTLCELCLDNCEPDAITVRKLYET